MKAPTVAMRAPRALIQIPMPRDSSTSTPVPSTSTSGPMIRRMRINTNPSNVAASSTSGHGTLPGRSASVCEHDRHDAGADDEQPGHDAGEQIVEGVALALASTSTTASTRTSQENQRNSPNTSTMAPPATISQSLGVSALSLFTRRTVLSRALLPEHYRCPACPPRCCRSTTSPAIAELAEGLHAAGWRLLSSGGTAREIAAHGVPVTDVAELTGMPAILGHRVVTLHPKVHGGILADTSDPSHRADLAEYGIEPIDLVVVNLYPFATEPGIELIDIGGPAMVRAAAKNHDRVAVVVDPADYDVVLAEIRADGGIAPADPPCARPQGVRHDGGIRRRDRRLARRRHR